MIWTLLMGITLATVFFFFSQRLNLGVANQRKSMEYLNAELLMESYADYLQSLNELQLEALRGDLTFEGMTGTLTNETEEITGMLDADAEVTYTATLKPASYVKVEWGDCPLKDTDLLSINSLIAVPSPGPCSTYGGLTSTTDPSFTLRALSGPINYKLSYVGDAKLYDNEWHLTLESIVSFRKKITLDRTFTPAP
jgi:hypothetical protein